ncbi:cytochrome-c peroxidase [Asticcacaulis sp.]|uniref:cytochrome-c peroxidase n=1 Tax=Asticcacaulis sp. TaxID=1872648 RepID=UPI002BDA1B3D|nr:cytochrome c peroxidase [Asticcacaulis sp.]HTM83213.1 cytochrome c peroxidase [Asticcacaulis sp.]
MTGLRTTVVTGAVLLLSGTLLAFKQAGIVWTDAQKAQILSLSLDSLPPLPDDPSNGYANDPSAVALGAALFADTRLSQNGKVACASCHLPEKQFQDGKAVGQGIGTGTRRTMPIRGTAYSPWFFWDGRADSQWAQALGPLENPVEHGFDRAAFIQVIAAHYKQPYEATFGPLPDLTGIPAHASPKGTPESVAAWARLRSQEQDRINRVFVNGGKAIAAFERTLQPLPTRFDRYANALRSGAPTEALFTAQEAEGLAIFIGKGNCINCHSGSMLTDNHFHNTGVPAKPDAPDGDRLAATSLVQADAFNCLGAYSDAPSEACSELTYMQADGADLIGAFKPPSLRGVTRRAPFMRSGQIKTIEEVIIHYSAAPPSVTGKSELVPLNLSSRERRALTSFLRTLD